MKPVNQYLLYAHMIYFAVLAVAITTTRRDSIGPILLLFVILYDLMILGFAFRFDNSQILDIWLFSAIFSLFQIFPDWYLSKSLEVLVFPSDGLIKIDTVSTYMLGLWTIPCFMITYIFQEITTNKDTRNGYLIAALAGTGIFWSSEGVAHVVGSWYAQNVTMLFKVALYILPAELLLSFSIPFAYQRVSTRILPAKILGAFLLMVFYLGAAVLSYFIFEDLIFN